MDRYDFSSISTCLKNHISESNQMSQPDFLYDLFEDFMNDPANEPEMIEVKYPEVQELYPQMEIALAKGILSSKLK